MNATVQKWGNSLALRLPAILAKDINLREGAKVILYRRDKGLYIEPCPKKKYTLKELVSGITKENLHSEIDTGAPIGNEIW